MFNDYNMKHSHETETLTRRNTRKSTDAERAWTSEALLVKLQSQQGLLTKLYTSRWGSSEVSHEMTKKEGDFIEESLANSEEQES